jgi:hypothetical protein
LPHFVCVLVRKSPFHGSLKNWKTTYRRTTSFVVSSLYFSFVNQYSLGGGFPFSVVLLCRYKLSLCHTPIKPDLLGFLGIGVFVCGLGDHVITRFASPLKVSLNLLALRLVTTPIKTSNESLNVVWIASFHLFLLILFLYMFSLSLKCILLILFLYLLSYLCMWFFHHLWFFITIKTNPFINKQRNQV